MARKYTVLSTLQSLAASTTKVPCQIATSSTLSVVVIGFDVSFDSTATGAAAVPVRVQLARTSAAGSGGTTFTPTSWNKALAAAQATARVNDTTGGTLTVVIKEWLVSPTSGLSYLYPLGRELELGVSDFLELRLVSQAGMTTCNASCMLHFEE